MVGKPEDDLTREEQADYRTFTLEGNHYEMGRQWGMIEMGKETDAVTAEEAAEAAQLLGLSVEQLGALGAGEEAVADESLSPSQLSFAQDCLQVVSNFHPPLIDEFQGWAEALGVGMNSVLSMLSFQMESRPHHCSAFAWKSSEGVVVGRNYDFHYWARTRHLIHAKPAIYYASVGMNDGLLGGRQDGVNEKRLFAALNRVETAEAERVEPGVIFHLVPRILLETCATAREAAMLAREIPHLMSYSYLIADPEEVFVVEAYPGTVRVREPEDGYIAVTNHFLHSDLQSLMRSSIQENSERRLLKIESALREAGESTDPWETATGILADHKTPVCGHTDGLATLWSMVADLTNRRLAYSMGAPCRNEYREFPWPAGGG